MASKLNSETMEKDAKATALKHICNMLQRPDQLEKIDQLKRRVKRNIVSIFCHHSMNSPPTCFFVVFYLRAY